MTQRRSVVVTGASTGIGAAIVRRLDRRGYRVFAGVRSPEDGDRLAVEGSGRIRSLLLDVTDPAQIGAAARVVAEATGADGLGGLVNNAGVGAGGPLEFLPIEDLRRVLEVNVVGLLAVTQAMLPALRLARGRIVNIGSIAGRTVAPMVGPYCASKHAVEALTDGLRLELFDAGIEVSVVAPGAVKTPIWAKGLAALERIGERLPSEGLARYGHRLEFFAKLLEANDRRGVAPDLVVDAVVHALEARRPRTRYLIGTDAKVRLLLRRLLPDRLGDAAVRAFLARAERRLARGPDRIPG